MMMLLLLVFARLLSKNKKGKKGMTDIKVFPSRIKDEYGGDFPHAIVAIRKFSRSLQETGEADESCVGQYDVETELEGISYKVNYWYTAQTKQQGVRSRPLLSASDDGFTDVFVVDLDHPETASVLASNMESREKTLMIITKDLARRFRA